MKVVEIVTRDQTQQIIEIKVNHSIKAAKIKMMTSKIRLNVRIVNKYTLNETVNFQILNTTRVLMITKMDLKRNKTTHQQNG